MKFFAALLLTAVVSFAACLYLPWYSVAIAAFIVAFLIPMHAGKAFLAAFLGIFLLWFLFSYFISIANDHILANRVSLLIIKSESPVMLVLLSALLGAVVAGLAALSGSLLRLVKHRI